MKYSRILWDWNGTLLNDAWLSVDVLCDMLGRRSLQNIDVDTYRASFGFPIIKFYEDLGFDFKKEPFEKVGTEFIEKYNAKRNLCSLNDGASALVFALEKAGVKQSILSAYEVNYLRQIVGTFTVAKCFEHIVGLDNIYAATKVKLGQDYFCSLNENPKTALFVGDTEHDAQTAQAIGCDCVLVAQGHFSKERLLKLGVPVFADFNELTSFLL